MNLSSIIPRLGRLIGVWIAISMTSPFAFASDLVWTQTLLHIKMDEHWSGHLEFQPRWLDGMNRTQTVMERGWVSAALNSDMRVGAGFLHAPQFLPSVRNENRIFEQLDWAPVFEFLGETVRWSSRTRLEQRYLESVPDAVAWRLREKLSLTWMPAQTPLSRFGLYLWDEVFFHLNGAAASVPSGFDQNRFSIGPRYNQASVTIEAGYLLQTVRSQPEKISENSGVVVSLSIGL